MPTTLSDSHLEVKYSHPDILIYSTSSLTTDEAAGLTEIGEVEEGLGTLFRELQGEEATIVAPRDITVGWETQIVAFDLKIPGEEPIELVVRIYPGNGGARKAEWEFNVMQRLNSVGYPVPRVFVYEASVETLGFPFLVMERISGSTLWDVFFSVSREKYGEILDVNLRLMANLHDISVNKVIPGVHRVKTRRRVLGRIDEEEKELEKYGLLPEFESVIGWLRGNAEEVTESPLCLIHQDFHPRNILLRGDNTPVVIDWAGCTVGDFREDLCWTSLLAGTFIDEALRQEIYDAYRKYSTRGLLDLPYFEVFAGLRRLADVVVTLREGASVRGMRPEALKDMENNKTHYSRVLSRLASVTGQDICGIGQLIGV
ncbi:MAG: phosphotransferase [Candidatus Bathyarchaeia archaeon]